MRLTTDDNGLTLVLWRTWYDKGSDKTGTQKVGKAIWDDINQNYTISYMNDKTIGSLEREKFKKIVFMAILDYHATLEERREYLDSKKAT